MFNWLPLSDRKGLPTPRVMLMDLDWCSGCFAARTKERCIDDVLGIDRSERDVIILSTHWGDVEGSTAAHEHRHFQQHYIQALPRLGICEPAAYDGTLAGWCAGIRRFYRSQPWEMDALIYSMRRHLDDRCEQEWEAVTKCA